MYNKQIDLSNMYSSIFDFSNHINNSFDFFKKNSSLNSKLIDNINSILILGMGGSAITGLIVKEMLQNDLNIPINVNQNYIIPNWVNKYTLVIACSYSGNTEETLIAYEECYKKNAKIIGFTTGGLLLKSIKSNNHSYTLMPLGLQPRAALGYSLPLLIMMLNKIGAIKNSYVENIKESITILKEKTIKYSKPTIDNIAFNIASNIYDKNPLIYAEDGIFNTIGYRFKSQLVENSKILAFNNKVPEMNHNEIEAFTNDVNKNNNFIVIWINDSSYHARNKKRIKVVSEIWKNKIDNQLSIEIKLEDCKNKILNYLSYLHLVDWISYHAAILKKIDPSIIPNINKLKNAL